MDFGGQSYIDKRKEINKKVEEGINLGGFVESDAVVEEEEILNQVDSESSEKKKEKWIKTGNYSSDQKIGLFYGSSTGNSEAICDIIQEELGEDVVELFNVADSPPEKFMDFSHIIVSCPTWYEGELQEDWIEYLPAIAALDLKGKTIVMFGMGDQEGYADNFLDALGIIAEDLIKAGAKVEGHWPIAGYDFTKSLGLAPSGDEFYGLGLDEENQAELHAPRLEKWFEMLVKIFNLTVEKIENELPETSDVDAVIAPDKSDEIEETIEHKGKKYRLVLEEENQ